MTVDDPTMLIAELIVDSKGGRTPQATHVEVAGFIVQTLLEKGWCPPEIVGPILEQAGGTFTLRLSPDEQPTYTVDHFTTELGERGVKVTRFG